MMYHGAGAHRGLTRRDNGAGMDLLQFGGSTERPSNLRDIMRFKCVNGAAVCHEWNSNPIKFDTGFELCEVSLVG